jgi:DNA-binding Lrp family transcriptional regulator
VTGEFDFLMRVEAANTFELARIIEILRSQEGVENTVTFIVLEKLK